MGDQYRIICRPRFDQIDRKVTQTEDRVHEIHAVVTNGLKDNMKTLSDRMKSLENRVWWMMGTITFGLLASIAVQLFMG